MELQIDSNIFHDKVVMGIIRKKVLDNKLKIVVSPIVILEFGYFQELYNKRQKFLSFIKFLKIDVKSITKSDAIMAIKHSMLYKDDRKGPMYYFRDSFIAALSERLRIPLITNNTKNFKGLPQSLKLTSEQVMTLIKSL